MKERLFATLSGLGASLGRGGRKLAGLGGDAGSRLGSGLYRARVGIIALSIAGIGAYGLYQEPPMKTVGRGEIGVRINQFTGEAVEMREGAVLVLPGLHRLRSFPLRDQLYRPDMRDQFQTVEGLSIGVDVTIRYALDPARIASIARNLPDDIGGGVVEPAAQDVLYKTLSRYTVREIFSSKRQEIRDSIQSELGTQLARDGIKLQGVMLGRIELPAEYRRGMDQLLAEEHRVHSMRAPLDGCAPAGWLRAFRYP